MCSTLQPWAVASAFLVAAFVSSSASADERPVIVVVGGGAAFRDAVALALSPWHVDVRRGDGAAPRSTMPRAADEARDIAVRYHAVGVAWLAAPDGSAPALFVYDAKTEQVVSRAYATGLPLDEPSAAAAALSVKTLFRSSTVAPLEERIGAEIVREAPDKRRLVPTEAPAPPAPRPAAPTAPTAGGPRLRLEVGGAIRSPAVSEADAQVGVGVAYHLGRDRAVGMALELRAGPGLAISTDRFVGRYTEVSGALWFRYRKRIGSYFALTPAVGTALRGSWLSGLVVGTTAERAESRADVAMALGLAAEWVASDNWLVGLEASVAYRARYQRYLVDAVPVLTLRAIEPTLALRISTGLL